MTDKTKLLVPMIGSVESLIADRQQGQLNRAQDQILNTA